MDCSTPGFPVHHQLLELAQTHVHWVVMTSNHLTLCRPLSYCVQYFAASGLSHWVSSLPQVVKVLNHLPTLRIYGWWGGVDWESYITLKKKIQWFSVPECSVEELPMWMDRLRAYADAQRWVSIMEAPLHLFCVTWSYVQYLGFS